MEFSWSDSKNKKNFYKHGVWFEEASAAFFDRHALEILDEESSQQEVRFILLAVSTQPRLLVVVYCEMPEECIRIISARKATREEARNYEKGI